MGKKRERLQIEFLPQFAPADEVKNETKYFKQQNIYTRLAEIKTEFQYIFTSPNTDIDPHPNKQSRYMQIKHYVSELAEWAHNGYEHCLAKYELYKEKEGPKEDCEYWMKLKTIGLKVKSEICLILSQINEKCVGFADAQTTDERSQKQERQKNRKRI